MKVKMKCLPYQILSQNIKESDQFVQTHSHYTFQPSQQFHTCCLDLDKAALFKLMVTSQCYIKERS